MKEKPRSKSKSKNALIGKYFHSFESDGKTIMWQGVVTAEVAPGYFLVQLFEWLVGSASNQTVVPVADMAYWRFYDDAEEMNNFYRDYKPPQK